MVAETRDGMEKTYRYDRRGNLTFIMKNGQTIQQYAYGALIRLEEAIGQAGKARSTSTTDWQRGRSHKKRATELIEPARSD